MLRSKTTQTILLAALAGVFAAVFSLSPQLNLWSSNGWQSNGIAASHDMDEACYAAYVQSLIDNKSRRNSPYTGVEDSTDTPLKESFFSIQVLASYPIAIAARVLGLSSPGALILAAGLYGFLTGLSVFLLFYILFRDPFLAFAGALVLLAAGALAAGQGNLIRHYAPSAIYYGISFPFARRVVPLAGFPALFLFFCGVWKILQTEEFRKRVFYIVGTLLAFVVLVFSYFYLWTAAFAWLAGLGLLLILLHPEKYREHLGSLSMLVAAMLVVLVPYFLLISNRSETTDSVQLLQYTRMPDLKRVPELISILVAAVFAALAVAGRINLRELRTLFLFSFALVAPIVFNQQVITGRSLQPVHYQFFVANYTALFALLSLVFLLLTNPRSKYLNKYLLLIAVVGFYVGYREITEQRSIDVLRDDIVPVASKIKSIANNDSELVMAFDLTRYGVPMSDEMPALSSQPVLWALHQRVFADLSADENLERFFYFLYFQNKDEVWLQQELLKNNSTVVHGVFGWSRSDNEILTKKDPVKAEEIEQYVDRYRSFIRGFDAVKAKKYPISFVVAHELVTESFGTFDRYYERDLIGKFENYLLFRTRPRSQDALPSETGAVISPQL